MDNFYSESDYEKKEETTEKSLKDMTTPYEKIVYATAVFCAILNEHLMDDYLKVAHTLEVMFADNDKTAQDICDYLETQLGMRK